MCRIFGYIGIKVISKAVFENVSSRQLSGGPDEQSIVQQDQWGLGNNRLAIQGIDGGRQPFYHDRIFCVFNGEIYNHNKLRRELESEGYHFDDTCDGSIIPILYRKYGNDFVQLLDGMFAIAIIDLSVESKPLLKLFSDSVGIKSVYYTYCPQRKIFAFSSEIPSLLEFNIASKMIRPEAINEYLAGRGVWGPNTIFENVMQLEPASIITVQEDGVFEKSTYLSDIDAEISAASIMEAGHMLDEILQAEVQQMLSADVPPCVVTSGGLDSSYITAIASQFSPNIHSFNIAYEGTWPFDEKEYAKKVADQYNTNHHQIIIQENEFPFLLEKFISSIGQPNNAPHCISTYALFSYVKKCGFKIALTGEGADEMFGGYERFRYATFNEESGWADNYLDKVSGLKKSARWASYSDQYKQYLSHDDHFHMATKNRLLALQEKYGRLDGALRFDQDDRFPYYILRRVDHLSMANSVEVRVPFCQMRIRALARKLPVEQKLDHLGVKKILYAAASSKLDQSILSRPKQPFTLPITAMLQHGHPLMKIVENTLLSDSFAGRKIFSPSYIKQLINEQLARPNNIVAQTIWSIMVLERWMLINNIDFRLD